MELPERRFLTLRLPGDTNLQALTRDDVADAVVRVVIECADSEQARKLPERDVRRVLDELGVHKVAGITYEYPHPERSRSSAVAKALTPEQALHAWAGVQRWSDTRSERLVGAFRRVARQGETDEKAP